MTFYPGNANLLIGGGPVANQEIGDPRNELRLPKVRFPMSTFIKSSFAAWLASALVVPFAFAQTTKPAPDPRQRISELVEEAKKGLNDIEDRRTRWNVLEEVQSFKRRPAQRKGLGNHLPS